MTQKRRNRPADDEAASTAAAGYHPTNIARQLRARRTASWRMVPLACGHRDPLTCTARGCHDERPLTDHQLEAWRAAAQHILGTGPMPLLELDVLRALWRRGGADRQLAELLHEASGEAIT